MALRDITVNRRPIKDSGGETLFEVRGLTPFDIGILMQTQAVQMLAAFGRAREAVASGEISPEEVQNVITDLIQSTPDVICGAIALAADEPEAVDNVRFLTLPVMTETLLTVYELTFTTEAELKKFVAVILKVIEVMTALIVSRNQKATKKPLKKS